MYNAESDSEATNYTYHDNLHFFYDAQLSPVKVRFSDELYTYLENAKGDVIGIIDSAGELVVEYQ